MNLSKLWDSEEQGRLLCCSLWGWTQIIVTKEQPGYQALSRVLGYNGDYTSNIDIVNGLLLVCPEGCLQMLCRSLEIPLVAAFQSVSSLGLRSAWPEHGEGRSAHERIPPVTSTTEGQGIAEHTAACSPFSGRCSMGARDTWAVTHSWAHVRWPASPPTSLPHSSCPWTQSMSQRSSLCKPTGGDTERKLQIVTNSYFFFPNRITAACYNHSNLRII